MTADLDEMVQFWRAFGSVALTIACTGAGTCLHVVLVLLQELWCIFRVIALNGLKLLQNQLC